MNYVFHFGLQLPVSTKNFTFYKEIQFINEKDGND